MTPEMLTAVGAVLLAVGSMTMNLVNARGAAKKTEMDLLRGVIDEQGKQIKTLQDDLKTAHQQIAVLQSENSTLRVQLNARASREHW